MPMPPTPDDCPLWEGWIPFHDVLFRLHLDTDSLIELLECGAIEKITGGAHDSPHSVVSVRIVDAEKVREIQNKSWAKQTVMLLTDYRRDE